jgi:hypothetical protein
MLIFGQSLLLKSGYKIPGIDETINNIDRLPWQWNVL